VQLHALKATHERAPKAAVALHPTEDLLDALSLSLADRVAGMARGARIQPRAVAAFDLRDMRGDALLS